MFQYLFNNHFIFYPTDNTHFALAFGAYEWVHMIGYLLILHLLQWFLNFSYLTVDGQRFSCFSAVCAKSVKVENTTIDFYHHIYGKERGHILNNKY